MLVTFSNSSIALLISRACRLATVRSLLDTDPEKARQLNTELGAERSSLPAMARTARREFEDRERHRQQELAQMVGVTRASVNKQLGWFEERGILTADRDGILILKPEQLQKRIY